MFPSAHRILMVNDFGDSHPVGGAERFVADLSKRIAGLGYDVTRLGLANPTDAVGRGAEHAGTISVLPEKPMNLELQRGMMKLYYRPAAVAVRESIRTWKPAIIHAHNCVHLSTEILAVQSEQTILTVHDYWPICIRRDLLFLGRETCAGPVPLKCWGCRLRSINDLRYLIPNRTTYWVKTNLIRLNALRRVVAPSRYMAAVLGSAGVSKERISVIPNGVDTDLFHPIRLEREPYVLFVGRSSPEKGLSSLIEVFRDERLADVTLKIVGPTRLPSVSKNVRLIGRVSTDRLVGLYARALCTVVPSLWPENCPMVALESLSCGTPVVASALGGLPEIVRDRECGVVFDPSNKDELLEKLTNLIGSPSRVERMGDTGRRLVSSEYALGAIAARYARVYEDDG